MKVRTTALIMSSILDSGRTIDMSGASNLLQFGNKASYLGGGWWYISDSGGTSLKKTIMAIRSLTRSGKVCVECGKLHICNDKCVKCASASSPEYW